MSVSRMRMSLRDELQLALFSSSHWSCSNGVKEITGFLRVSVVLLLSSHERGQISFLLSLLRIQEALLHCVFNTFCCWCFLHGCTIPKNWSYLSDCNITQCLASYLHNMDRGQHAVYSPEPEMTLLVCPDLPGKALGKCSFIHRHSRDVQKVTHSYSMGARNLLLHLHVVLSPPLLPLIIFFLHALFHAPCILKTFRLSEILLVTQSCWLIPNQIPSWSAKLEPYCRACEQLILMGKRWEKF